MRTGIRSGISNTALNSSDSDPLESQYLQGPGYVWLTVWQNNFSNDTLGIDDVTADTVSETPEPAGLWLSTAGLGLVLTGLSRRRLFASRRTSLST